MAIQTWHLGILFNGTIALAYAAIGLTILIGLRRAGQMYDNPLAVATALIMLSCSMGHATHLEHLVFGPEVPSARIAFDWHMVWVDGITAVVGVVYWSLRGRFGVLLRPSMFADDAARRDQATTLQATVLQDLVTAQLALDSQDPAAARAAVARATLGARTLIDGLESEVVRVA